MLNDELQRNVTEELSWGDVLQALMLDSLIPPTVDAQVDDGSVKLTGRANWQFHDGLGAVTKVVHIDMASAAAANERRT